MSVSTTGTVKRIRIKRVVAVCEHQGERIATGTPQIDPFFTLHARYRPPATALFRLSILVNKSTIYVQLSPNRIESLKRTTCDHRKKDPGICFDVISKQLDGHRSFTRLQFQLLGHADIIVPKDLNLDHCDAEARCNFAAVVSVATATNFSLYMPRDVLRKEDYKVFSDAIQQVSKLAEDQDSESERLADLPTLYNGKGGVLFDPSQHGCLALVHEVVTVGPLPNDVKKNGPAPSVGEQSTTDSDTTIATVAVGTPPEFQANDRDDLPPPYYCASAEGPKHASPHPNFNNNRKHDLSSGEGNINSRSLFKRKRRQASTVDILSHSHPPATHSTRALEIHVRKQEEEIQHLKAEIARLQRRTDALQKQCHDMERRNDGLEDLESRQESVEKTLEAVYANIDVEVEQGCLLAKDELRQEFEGTMNDHLDLWTEENMGEMVEGYMGNCMEQYVIKYMEQKVEGFMADMRRKFRSVLDD